MDTVECKEKLKEKFISKSIEHGEVYCMGEYKKANRLHKNVTKIYHEICERNYIELLYEFINHKEESVQIWGATFLLKHDSDIAIKKLNDLTQLSSIYGLDAKTTIDMWKKGMI